MRVKELVAFMKAREHARQTGLLRGQISERAMAKRVANTDPIIAKYRFCNVRRNDDRVTKWLMEEYYPRFKNKKEIWFAAVVARLFNNPDALKEIAPFVLPYRAGNIVDRLRKRRDRGEKNFNAAYIVSTNGRSMDKVEYIVQHVLTPMWELRPLINEAMRGATLEQAHYLLMKQNGMASFMAAQVVADLKYVTPMINATDFHTFAASGPGSKRGLARVMDLPVGQPWQESVWRARLVSLHEAVQKHFNITAQDLQNCLCEFDKFERARLGEGTPKQIYKPHREG